MRISFSKFNRDKFTQKLKNRINFLFPYIIFYVFSTQFLSKKKHVNYPKSRNTQSFCTRMSLLIHTERVKSIPAHNQVLSTSQ